MAERSKALRSGLGSTRSTIRSLARGVRSNRTVVITFCSFLLFFYTQLLSSSPSPFAGDRSLLPK